MQENAALTAESMPADLKTQEEEDRLSEQEGADGFDYHPVPPLSVVRIKARVRTISIGQPMPYVLSGQE